MASEDASANVDPFFGMPFEVQQNGWPVRHDGKDVDPRYADLADRVRDLLDAYRMATPAGEAFDELTAKLDEAITILNKYVQQNERRWLTEPVLWPPFYADEWDRDYVKGRVTFSPFFNGANSAVHGGVITLMYDVVLGRLGNYDRRPVARTAYLKVDYRNITPIGKELTLVARVYREEGRKRFVSGQMLDGDTVCNEADSLFVALLPGMP